MERKKQKQIQWGFTILLGIFILAGTVGHLENGGDMAPNVVKAIIGTIISSWGVVKSYQWGFFDEE